MHDRRIEEPVPADVHLTRSCAGTSAAAGCLREIERPAPPDRGHLEADELDHLALDQVAVALRVQLVEAPERPLERGVVQLAGVDLDLVLVVLAEVAHVDRAADLGLAREALLPQLADGPLGDAAGTGG